VVGESRRFGRPRLLTRARFRAHLKTPICNVQCERGEDDIQQEFLCSGCKRFCSVHSKSCSIRVLDALLTW
jgi:hypothetical protein